MKKSFALVLTLLLCLGCFTACTATAKEGETEPAAAGTACITCRLVDGAGTGSLLLAKQDGSRGDVYRLSTEGLAILDAFGQEAALKNGMLVEILYDGTILETYPASFSAPTRLRILSPLDDKCAMYLQVLNDLWAVDEGLNTDITQLGVDLSGTSLSQAEQAAVAWAFGEEHNLTPILATYSELVEQGYITGEPMEGTDKMAYQWKGGCLFSISEKTREGIYNTSVVTFDAQKWRSGLGAYFYSDCTSVQSGTGHWADYQIGSEAIS